MLLCYVALTVGVFTKVVIGVAPDVRAHVILQMPVVPDQSRNRRMGLALAAGHDVASAEREIRQVVEGVRVAREVHRIADHLGVEMPIASQAYRVLHEGVSPPEAVRRLTDRPFRSEKD